MTIDKAELTMNIKDGTARIRALEQEIKKSVIGQDRVVREMIIGLLGGGHILIEGVPGLGKTLLARTMAKAAGSQFNRIQFTPDLMPSDITGHSMFDMQDNVFKIRRGPIFCHILLADEINRAPAKTQSALLEAMQEQQVTIEGKSLKLAHPFLVMATQNPIEQEGTYPLPQAQTDRFMFKIYINYPDNEQEIDIVQSVTSNSVGDGLDTDKAASILSPGEIIALQQLMPTMTADEQIVNYVVAIVRATRSWNGIDYGAGPRGAINLLRAARGSALLSGRDFITPDDVKDIALPVLRHRIKLSADMEIEGYTADMILTELLDTVKAPRL
ncbi:MAG: MoxR family ATPase [Desulfocapsaceae bacterium]|nr:MoxR family ATPase [Desulfocapsaceae bacterium]